MSAKPTFAATCWRRPRSTTNCSRRTTRPIRASPPSAEELKKKGVKDFQLDYAIKTLKRLAGTAAAAEPAVAPKKGALGARWRTHWSPAAGRRNRPRARRGAGAADRLAAAGWRCSAGRSARNMSAGFTRARCATGSAGRMAPRSCFALLAFTAPAACPRARNSHPCGGAGDRDFGDHRGLSRRGRGAGFSKASPPAPRTGAGGAPPICSSRSRTRR